MQDLSWWEWFGVLTGSGGLVASILGAWLTAAARGHGQATRELARELHGHTAAQVTALGEGTEAMVRELQGNTEALMREMSGETAVLLRELQGQTIALVERLDKRADERHRETLEVLKAWRG